MQNDEIKQLCDIIRETCFEIHNYLRHGHLEKIYENALAHRLEKKGIKVEKQYPLSVYDEDGTLLGDFYADLFVERKLIVELKACNTITNEHVAQLLGYLRASKVEHGLLINLGSAKLQVNKYILNNNV